MYSIINFGIAPKQSKSTQMQIRALNIDMIACSLVVFIYFVFAFFYPQKWIFVYSGLAFLIINTIIILYNRKEKHQFAAILATFIYPLAISSIVILFGKDAFLYLFLISSSFSPFTYFIKNKTIAISSFLFHILLFVGFSIIDFTPIYIFTPEDINIFSKISLLLFSLLFSHKMVAILLHQYNISKEEVLLHETTKQNELLQSIINSLPQYIYWKDNNDTYQGGNIKFTNITGLQHPKQLNGKINSELSASHDLFDFITKDFSPSSNGSPIYNHENEYFSSNGKEYWLLSNKIPLKNSENKITGTLFTHEDISLRKRIELEKKESEQKFKKLFENSPYGIGLRDFNTLEVFSVNPKLKEIFKIPNTHDKLIHKSEISPWEDKERFDKMKQKLMDKEIIFFDTERQFKRFDGSLFWGKITRSLMNINNKLYLVGFIEDIDNRKKTELEIKKSEEKFKRLFESSPFGIALRDLKTNTLVALNPQLKKLFKISDNDLSKIDKENFTLWEDQKHYDLMLQKLLNNEINSFAAEKLYKRQGGTSFWGKVTRSLITINNSLYLIGFVENIDQKKKGEIKLQQSELKYRSLFENSFDGILIYDSLQNKVLDVNKKILQLFKLKNNDEFFQQNPLQYSPKIQPDGTPSDIALQNILDNCKKKDSFTFQWLYILHDGTELLSEVHTFRNKTHPHLFTSIYKDITEKNKQEQLTKQTLTQLNEKNNELKKYIDSNMQLENFAYVASHDLKGPIRTIVGFSQLLQKRTGNKLNHEEKEYLDFILSATKNMYNLINDLLNYSRVDSQVKQSTQISLNVLINNIIQSLHSSISQNNTKIITNNIPKFILADETKIKQLFQNLIANGIKFTREKEQPIIEINCIEKKNKWQFSVKDNGIGIKEEYFEKIFLLFKKLHTHDQYEGTGIGLSLCKKIVEQHHGKIWLSSELGKGTTFYFTIKK